jgi:hypothetical protein
MANQNPIQPPGFLAQKKPATGDTEMVGVKLPPEIKSWLRTLPGGTSYNVRLAILDYKNKLEENA